MGEALISVVLPALIAGIMCSLGLTLTGADFRRLITRPRGVAIGMLNMVVIAPLLAVAMAELFGLRPELAVGLVLLGAAPGGMMANMYTHLARGDTALSVTMTAISSVGAVITVPLYLSLAADHFGATEIGAASMPGIVAKVFAVTVIPVAIGMSVRQRRPEFVAAHYPRLRNVSLVLFGLVVAGAIVSEYDTVAANLTVVGGAALALNVAAMSAGFAVSRLARLDYSQATAISLELGIHNAALAVAVGASLSTDVAVPAAVYATFMVGTGAMFAWAMGRRDAVRGHAPRAGDAAALTLGGRAVREKRP